MTEAVPIDLVGIDVRSKPQSMINDSAFSLSCLKMLGVGQTAPIHGHKIGSGIADGLRV